MPSSYTTLTSILESYLFKDKNSNWGVVIVAKYCYPNVVSKIKNNICPWCNRRFRAKVGLRVHLKSERCGFLFRCFIDDCINIYHNFRESVYSSYLAKYKSLEKALKVYLINVKH